jgi:VWFA-related protein
MNALRWGLSVLFLLGGSGLALRSAAQAPIDGQQQVQAAPDESHPQLTHRPPPAPGGNFKLDVVVTDRSGHPVAGLQQSQFTLLVNKKPQPILSFQEVDGSTGNGTPDDPPVEIILLIDATNNSLTDVAYERAQIEKFLRQDGGHLKQPVTLILFSEYEMRVLLQHSTDGNLLAETLEKAGSTLHVIRRSGGYDAIERVELSLNTLQQIANQEDTETKPGRKMLIWIGPGTPMLEGPGYEALSDTTQHQIFGYIVDTTQELQDSRITLYAVGMTNDAYESFLKPVPSVNKAQAGNLALPVFAIHSGGLAIVSFNDYIRALNSCFSDAKVYYRIGFDVPNVEHAHEYQSLEVTVAQHGLKARTNAGYYAEPSPKP